MANRSFNLIGVQESSIVRIQFQHNSQKVIKYTAKLTFYQKIIAIEGIFSTAFHPKKFPVSLEK